MGVTTDGGCCAGGCCAGGWVSGGCSTGGSFAAEREMKGKNKLSVALTGCETISGRRTGVPAPTVAGSGVIWAGDSAPGVNGLGVTRVGLTGAGDTGLADGAAPTPPDSPAGGLASGTGAGRTQLAAIMANKEKNKIHRFIGRLILVIISSPDYKNIFPDRYSVANMILVGMSFRTGA